MHKIKIDCSIKAILKSILIKIQTMDKTLKALIILLGIVISVSIIIINNQIFSELFIFLSENAPILYVYIIALLWLIIIPLSLIYVSYFFDKIVNYNIGMDLHEKSHKIPILVLIYFCLSFPVLIAITVNAIQFNLFKFDGKSIAFIFLITMFTLISVRQIYYYYSGKGFNSTIGQRFKDLVFSLIMANIVIAVFILSHALYVDPATAFSQYLFYLSYIKNTISSWLYIGLLYILGIIGITIVAECSLVIMPKLKIIGWYIVIYMILLSIVLFFSIP